MYLSYAEVVMEGMGGSEAPLPAAPKTRKLLLLRDDRPLASP